MDRADEQEIGQAVRALEHLTAWLVGGGSLYMWAPGTQIEQQHMAPDITTDRHQLLRDTISLSSQLYIVQLRSNEQPHFNTLGAAARALLGVLQGLEFAAPLSVLVSVMVKPVRETRAEVASVTSECGLVDSPEGADGQGTSSNQTAQLLEQSRTQSHGVLQPVRAALAHSKVRAAVCMWALSAWACQSMG